MTIIQMLGDKRTREFDTTKPTEKIPAIKNFGVILYDIPIAITLENLKKISRSESFIPKYKKMNMRIAFFICESEKERENIYKSAPELNPLIKWTDFTLRQPLIKNAISSLKSISNNFTNMLESNNRIIPTLKHQPGYYFNKNKQLALKILGDNYIDIEKSFSYCLTNQTITAQDEINTDKNIEWELIFYWCWFILYKVTEQTLIRYESFFIYFGKDLNKTFKKFSKCNYLIKYLVFDFLSQYFYFEKVFNNELQLIRNLKFLIIDDNIIVKFTDKFNSIAENTKTIFNSKIIQNSSKKLLKIKNNKEVVNEFIENTYVISLPESIKGYTLCNRTVMIQKLEDSSIQDEHDTLFGFTLMTMIHEFAHFGIRFNLKSDYAWFEKASPMIHGSKESGSSFIKEIFGYEPFTITPAASRFISDPINWTLSHKAFKNEFTDLNPYRKEFENTSKQRRLKQSATDSSNSISLIGCKYSYRRQQEARSKKI